MNFHQTDIYDKTTMKLWWACPLSTSKMSLIYILSKNGSDKNKN